METKIRSPSFCKDTLAGTRNVTQEVGHLRKDGPHFYTLINGTSMDLRNLIQPHLLPKKYIICRY